MLQYKSYTNTMLFFPYCRQHILGTTSLKKEIFLCEEIDQKYI